MRGIIRTIEGALASRLVGSALNTAPIVTPSSGGPTSVEMNTRTISATHFPLIKFLRRVGPWIGGLSSLALLLAVGLVGWALNQSMQQLVRDSLETTLLAHVRSLEHWLAERIRESDRIANNVDIQNRSVKLITASEEQFKWTAADASAKPSVPSIDSLLNPNQTVGWAILDTNDQVIDSSFAALIGKRLPIPDPVRRQALSGKSTVSEPFAFPIAIAGNDDPDGKPITDAPIIAAVSPLHSDETVVGMITVLIDPAGPLSNIFAATRSEVGGETYAVDRNGRMISRSRYEKQLRKVGVLPPDPRVTSSMQVSVRDPGYRLLDGDKISQSVDEWPLTEMANQLTRGGSGENVSGYRDYRGVKVVGAWAWLPEYQFGVATEFDFEQAYAPMKLLRRLMIGLLLISAIVGATTILLALMVRRMVKRLAATQQNQRRIGQYELGESLGRGGMGAVFRATHDLLGRTVAIKVLERDSQNSVSIARFEREAKMTAGLRHPSTISLYDFGRTDQGELFYVMEYVDGITLQRLVDRYGRQPPARVIHLLLQICGSLSEAHWKGIIHRDIKPANLMLSTQPGMHDLLKVLDFGLVKDIVQGPTDLSLTTSEGITGTPMYMPPETVRDASMSDHRSDIYAVGGVGYTLLTGKPMFEGDASVEICMKQLKEDPLRPADRLASHGIHERLPDDLQNILMACLRKDPTQRPASIDDLAAALRHCDDATGWDDVAAMHWWTLALKDGVIDDTTSFDDADRDSEITWAGEGDASATAH
ncbi:serine/threonine protein kinase [Rubripirellula reticaptiva]|uniref:Serine/threonine-protein kinase PknB n=1 Tax=Rubripirellula reticaptiva TaxID=2528013 RepID=A0A5C6ESQ1_9BACT|nr:serine/threonine protein kinase [Rubripirellula reticaptiva]TWU51384.1 Serine/threonine-protein kinase PknB [Rubripirellula reticaptiva]